jgi:hypothetical protein
MRSTEITEFGIAMQSGDMDGTVICPCCNKEFAFIIKGNKLKELMDAWKE